MTSQLEGGHLIFLSEVAGCKSGHMTTIGQFSVDSRRVLGEGGFSRVFMARHLAGDHTAAAKQIFLLASVRTTSVHTCPSANVFGSERAFDQEKAVSFILAESRRRCTPIYNDGELGSALPFPGSYT